MPRARTIAQLRAKQGQVGHAPGTGAASASQPGTDLRLLRTSERSTFNRCRFLWDLTYNRELKPHYDMPALRFGTLIHKALAGWYVPGIKRGVNPATAFEKLYKEELKTATKMGFRDEDGKWYEAGELGVNMMTAYLEEYGKDEEWEVLATELPFRTIVYKDDGVTPWFVYAGVVDGLWRHRPTKRLWIPDHKTTDGIGPKTGEHLRLDNQAGSYWTWGVRALQEKGWLKENDRLHGMLYNYMRKAMQDTRAFRLSDRGKKIYLNNDGSDSKKQPSPYFLRLQILRDAADRAAQEVRSKQDFREMELAREGVIQRDKKSPGQFTCIGCSMIDVCELHETGHDWEQTLASTTQHWNPYAEHEIYAAETK